MCHSGLLILLKESQAAQGTEEEGQEDVDEGMPFQEASVVPWCLKKLHRLA